MTVAPAQDLKQLHGRSIIDALKQARVDYILSVPDLHTSHGLLRPLRDKPRLCGLQGGSLHRIAAGLSYANKRAVRPHPATRISFIP